ncbi:hypothetical protein [Kribbella sp. CA-293567]|uniref:hypothetical protein n=1 Tax=Kribbella sp. CA-293567 TaxID=3002436 RepID=UPI0022DE2D02|nr:hypothetical protein [Kribbella sp. CA-293567]WBQ03021.1 hypothetical protein OX958_23925 [Kribbella sp. CA-293567]
MISAHLDAFTALIAAHTPAIIWYVGESPALAGGGYVTLYPDTGNREPVDLADANPMRVWTVTANYSGDDVAQVLRIAELVEAALKNQRPTVPGRSCSRIKRLIARPVTRDDDNSPARFSGTDVWRWYSTPAQPPA